MTNPKKIQHQKMYRRTGDFEALCFGLVLIALMGFVVWLIIRFIP